MSGTSAPPILDAVRIATPCTARWADMIGDERVRRCGLCKLDVYNVAEMSRAEAETLLRERTGRTCMRIFRRADGTVLTRDCPSALRAVRRRVAWAAATLIAIGASGAAMFFPRGARDATSNAPATVPGVESPPPLMGEACLPAPDPEPRGAVMGDVCLPSSSGDPRK